MTETHRTKLVKFFRGNFGDRYFRVAVLIMALIWFVSGSNLLHGQAPPTRLRMVQVEQLIRAGTPDTAIAREIQRSGLDFVPSKDTLEALRRLGAGPQTLQAVNELRPMLDEAKQSIPGILAQIYKALDQGNWQAVRPLFSPELASNSQKLDSICKPFTYRAHYIESIIERLHGQFEVRVRVLFQPLDEQAYVLLFGTTQGQFFLQDVTVPPLDWFGPEFSAAGELTRRFIYAIKAGRQDILVQSVSPGVDTSRLTTDPCWQLQLQRVNQVNVDNIYLKSYKGLKAEVRAGVPGTFLVEQINGEYKIVSAFTGIEKGYLATDQTCRDAKSVRTAEDPNLESYTLKRFGLPVPAVSEYIASPAPGGSPAPLAKTTGALLASCGLYESCLVAARAALKSSQLDQSLAKFQEATQLDPSRGDAWAGIGTAYLQMGRYDEAASMWNKALQLGATLSATVCHAGALCGDVGTLMLNTKEISFVNAKGQKELTAAPSEVTSEGAVQFGNRPSYYLQIRFEKNWRFYYQPNAMQCSLNYICPEPGPAQQRAFASYVHNTLVKLAAGQFAANPVVH